MNGLYSPNFSLSSRLGFLILGAQVVLLSLLAVLVFFVSKSALMSSFDQSLISNVEALASLVESEEDEPEGIEFDFNEKPLPAYSSKTTPDHFAVILDRDRVLRTSERLSEVPNEVFSSESYPMLFNYEYQGAPYRAIVITSYSTPRADEMVQGRSFRMFFARSLYDIHRQLRYVALAISILCLMCIVASVLVARWIARAGLKPVSLLAQRIGSITEDQLTERVDDSEMPSELQPIASSINILLDRLQVAFENERRFSADAAHELRTPIATMKSGIQVAQMKQGHSPETLMLLDNLLLDVDRLVGLCDALLLMTKQDDPSDKSLCWPDWVAEIESAVFSVRNTEEEANWSIVTDLALDPIPQGKIKTDASTTFRIVSNLVENAVRYGGPKVEIGIHVRQEVNQLFLIVEDNGPGIPVSSTNQLFERFYRVDKSRSREQGGYGLGLSICRTLSRTHGGDIIYEPNSPTGAKFTWMLDDIVNDE